jgi:7-cyano-7-deazaguanine reductase
MSKKKSSYDGLQENIRKLKTPPLDTWSNKYPDRDYIVSIKTDEFNCICPNTGLPDFAKINIEYVPDKKCLELKSFKEYLVSYRNIGIYHEHAINKIFDDFIKAVKPKCVKIEGIFNIRGGITTSVSREYKKKGYKRK